MDSSTKDKIFNWNSLSKLVAMQVDFNRLDPVDGSLFGRP